MRRRLIQPTLIIDTFPIIRYKNSNQETVYWNTYSGKKAFHLKEVKEKGVSYGIYDLVDSLFVYGIAIQYDEDLHMVGSFFARLPLKTNMDSMEDCISTWETMDIVLFDENKNVYSQIFKHTPARKLPAIKDIRAYNSIETDHGSFARYATVDYDDALLLYNGDYILINQKFGNNCGLYSIYPNKHYDMRKIGAQYPRQDFLAAPFRQLFGRVVSYVDKETKSFIVMELSSLNNVVDYLTNSYSESFLRCEVFIKETEYIPEIGIRLKDSSDIIIPDEIKKQKKLHRKINDRYRTFPLRAFSVLERLEAGFVLRCFYVSKYEDTMIETMRIYYTNRLASFINDDGTWKEIEIPNVKDMKDSKLYYMYLDDINDELSETRYGYIGNIINSLPPVSRTSSLVNFLRFPWLETLYNSELRNTIRLLLVSPQYNSDFYQEIETQEGKLNFITGLNKYQLTKLAGYDERRIYDISLAAGPFVFILYKAIMKPINNSIKGLDIPSYAPCNICDLDNKTSDMGFEILEELLKKQDTCEYTLVDGEKQLLDVIRKNPMRDTYTQPQELYVFVYYLCSVMKKLLSLKSLEDTRNLVVKLIKITERPSDISIYDKILKTAIAIGTTDIDFETKEDIEDIYERISSVDVIIDMKDKKKQWDERCKYWRTYEYKGDYLLMSPKHPADFIKEGKALRHCVGKYLERVLEKQTNIFFIRKKESPNTPFFTVEVENNIIEQVHGFGNGNAPKEVRDFIYKWAKVKNLQVGNIDQLRQL